MQSYLLVPIPVPSYTHKWISNFTRAIHFTNVRRAKYRNTPARPSGLRPLEAASVSLALMGPCALTFYAC